MNMTSHPVRVTIGIPVYNGEETIEAAIRSVLDQTFEDLEVLVVDNASTDRTSEICTRLAEEDPRVRHVRNETNIGQNPNFTRTLELAGGEYFRWMGDDDWLYPDYVQRCVEALDSAPDAVACTTFQEHVSPDGNRFYEEYTGPRVTGSDPIARFDRMLRFLTSPFTWIDPVYTMFRRSSMEASPGMRSSRFGDLMFSCELALAGPFVHVPALLCGRNWIPIPTGSRAYAAYTGRTSQSPRDWIVARSQRIIFCWQAFGLVGEVRGLTLRSRMRAAWAVLTYYVRKRSHPVTRRISVLRDRVEARASSSGSGR